MNTNANRVKELEDFSNDFLKKLRQDEEESNNIFIKKPINTEIKQEISKNNNSRNNSYRKNLNLPNFSITKSFKKNKRKKENIVINIYNILYIVSKCI